MAEMYHHKVSDLNSTNRQKPVEAARQREEWKARLDNYDARPLDEQSRVVLRDLVDKLRAQMMTEKATANMMLHEDWLSTFDTSAYKHLFGCNNNLGEARILELLLSNEDDIGLLWMVCWLARYAWRKDARRLLGDNRTLGLQSEGHISRINAGARTQPVCSPDLSAHPTYLPTCLPAGRPAVLPACLPTGVLACLLLAYRPACPPACLPAGNTAP
jgi:hypothetical protein